jgi:hypothetical protein
VRCGEGGGHGICPCDERTLHHVLCGVNAIIGTNVLHCQEAAYFCSARGVIRTLGPPRFKPKLPPSDRESGRRR